MKFCSVQKILMVLCCSFEQHRRRQFERGPSCQLQTTRAIARGAKSSCLLLRIVLHDEVTEPMNAHVDVQIQTEVSARSLQGTSKGSVETHSKGDRCREAEVQGFLLLRLEMRGVFHVLPEAASKILQTTGETTRK